MHVFSCISICCCHLLQFIVSSSGNPVKIGQTDFFTCMIILYLTKNTLWHFLVVLIYCMSNNLHLHLYSLVYLYLMFDPRLKCLIYIICLINTFIYNGICAQSKTLTNLVKKAKLKISSVGDDKNLLLSCFRHLRGSYHDFKCPQVFYIVFYMWKPLFQLTYTTEHNSPQHHC